MADGGTCEGPPKEIHPPFRIDAPRSGHICRLSRSQRPTGSNPHAEATIDSSSRRPAADHLGPESWPTRGQPVIARHDQPQGSGSPGMKTRTISWPKAPRPSRKTVSASIGLAAARSVTASGPDTTAHRPPAVTDAERGEPSRQGPRHDVGRVGGRWRGVGGDHKDSQPVSLVGERGADLRTEPARGVREQACEPLEGGPCRGLGCPARPRAGDCRPGSEIKADSRGTW
jgi:hypothetical protein